MGCNLHVIGKDLDTITLLSAIKMIPYKIKNKGEPRAIKKPAARFMTYSLVSFLASDADFDEFEKQKEDVIAFILINKEYLIAIKNNSEVEYFNFDFGIANKMKWHQSTYFEPDFISLLATYGIGIELTMYLDSEQ
jgi:hypothetical protein